MTKPHDVIMSPVNKKKMYKRDRTTVLLFERLSAAIDTDELDLFKCVKPLDVYESTLQWSNEIIDTEGYDDPYTFYGTLEFAKELSRRFDELYPDDDSTDKRTILADLMTLAGNEGEQFAVKMLKMYDLKDILTDKGLRKWMREDRLNELRAAPGHCPYSGTKLFERAVSSVVTIYTR